MYHICFIHDCIDIKINELFQRIFSLILAAQKRAQEFRDIEVESANQAINLQHAQMHRTDAYHELRMHEPNMQIQTEVSEPKACVAAV